MIMQNVCEATAVQEFYREFMKYDSHLHIISVGTLDRYVCCKRLPFPVPSDRRVLDTISEAMKSTFLLP